jgi:hypothetical protein
MEGYLVGMDLDVCFFFFLGMVGADNFKLPICCGGGFCRGFFVMAAVDGALFFAGQPRFRLTDGNAFADGGESAKMNCMK